MTDTAYKNYGSVNRYADFIQTFQGKIINLNKEIERFKAADGKGIGRGTKPWIHSKIAKRVGPKSYQIIYEPSLIVQNAQHVLDVRRVVYPREYVQRSEQPKITEAQAITFLKSKGYKILKPETQYTEI
jgi:hypothetical protein